MRTPHRSVAIRRFVGCLLVASTLVAPAFAAPLDVMLSAVPERGSIRGFLELTTDQMNSELDVFRVRESDPNTVGTSAGDYHGYHITGALRVQEAWWVSGSIGRRAVSSASDTFYYDNFAVATQLRFADAALSRPAMALRLSAWGNQAAATQSSSPVSVPGAILNTVRIEAPADRSMQVDLIGTWVLPNRPVVNTSFGIGWTQLRYGGLTATTTRNGCDYALVFNGNDIYGSLAQDCNATGGVIQQFYDSSGAYGVDVAPEIAWRGRFWQWGASLHWQGDPWSYKLGYLYHAVQREAVDSILASRGKPHFAQNHLVLLQSDYRISPNVYLLGRVQLSSNLFFSEMPVTYNSSTSERFGSKYSVFSLGIRWAF